MSRLVRPDRCSIARRARPRGFTLVELVITLALVGILALAVVPFSQLIVQREKEQQLSGALREIRTALDAYKEASDDGLIEREAEASGYPPSLAVLVDGVKNVKDPKGGLLMFLRRVPRDPFGEGWGLRSYQSSAKEPQEGKDVFDVYSRSQEIGLNAIPYREW